jgi:hypothetical protein
LRQNNYCPVCIKALDENEEVPMIMCDFCDFWVHVTCDPTLTEEMYEHYAADASSKYKCPTCLRENRNEPTRRARIDTDRKPFKPLALEHAVAKSACRLCHRVDESTDNVLCGPFRFEHLNDGDLVWLHEKCVRWSPGDPPYEVPLYSRSFYDLGALLKYGQKFCCSLQTCSRRGATIGCHNPKCHRVYHYPCAVTVWGEFDSYEFYCDTHAIDHPRQPLQQQQQPQQPLVTVVNDGMELEPVDVVDDDLGSDGGGKSSRKRSHVMSDGETDDVGAKRRTSRSGTPSSTQKKAKRK